MFRKLAILFRALRTLARFPLRSGLTILSAALGVSGALTSVNYALAGRAMVIDRLSQLGTNVLIVTPEQSRSVGGRARTASLVTTLTLTDYNAIRRQIPLFSRSSALSAGSFLIKAGDLSKKNCVVIGIEPDYLPIKRWELDQGVAFHPADLRRMARIVLLGASVSRDLFGDASPLGKRLLINRVPFQVAGVLTERGQSLDAANEDDQVYVPLTTAMHRLSNIDYFSGTLFAVDRWQDMDQAAEATTALLRLRHNTDFKVQNQKQLLDTQIAASAQLLLFVRWIGASALCVSGLGILAISWIAVRERTREIGTRRALGATQIDIFLQIVGESLTLGALGCLLGTLIAAEVTRLLAAVFDQPSAWLAVAVACLLNTAFAALPAQSAAKLHPIQALRFE